MPCCATARSRPRRLPFPQRLNILFEDMTQLLEVTKPEAVAVEELFWGTISRPALAFRTDAV